MATYPSHIINQGDRLVSSQLLDVIARYKNAIAIYTTHDIIIEYANDAMLALWRRDKSVIGLPLDEGLTAVKSQTLVSMVRNVLNTGVDDMGEAIPAHLEVDGKLQTFYFDYAYRAISNEAGIPYCVLHTAEDVTHKVLGTLAIEKARAQEEALYHEQVLNEELAATNEELSATNEELKNTQEKLYRLNQELEARVARRAYALTESENRLRYMITDAPAAISLLNGRDMVIESASNQMLNMWGKSASVIGKPLTIAMPQLAGQPILSLLDAVFTTGETYYGNESKTLVDYGGGLKEGYFNIIYKPVKDAGGQTTSIFVVANDVTEQVRARRLTEENEKRFRFMLNAIPQQVWTATPDGALDYVNQVISNDFGGDAWQIVGNGWQKYIHPDDLPGALNAWTIALQTGRDYMTEFRLLFSDGEYRWHLARAVPLIDDGQITFWLGTNTNIDLQKSNEQKKDEFLSIASHELKTPLTSIKAFNQLMLRSSDPSRLEGFIKKSAGHIVRLERLIADLLDVTKINAGKMEYTMEPFSFNKLVAESIESVQHMAPSHQIILESTVDVTYTGDYYRLEQVMNNFLTNAVKYSPETERVIVNSKLDQGSIIVSVQDFGIGIAEHNLDRLFDRYYRVDNTAMRFEGLGLGLFISSEILKGHRGSFWIESRKGEGSTFYFRLPLNQIEVEEVIKTRTRYKDSTINIVYNADAQRLEVDWTGFQNFESVQRGCLNMLDILVKNNCKRIINDNRHVLGTWSEASEWVGEVFFPMMEKAGVQMLAWVFSPIVFSQLSAKKSIHMGITHITTKFFTDLAEAQAWIGG